MAEIEPDGLTGFGARLRDALSDSLAYWEPRRIVYNAVLAAIVLAYFAINWPYSRGVVSLEGSLFVFILKTRYAYEIQSLHFGVPTSRRAANALMTARAQALLGQMRLGRLPSRSTRRRRRRS